MKTIVLLLSLAVVLGSCQSEAEKKQKQRAVTLDSLRSVMNRIDWYEGPVNSYIRENDVTREDAMVKDTYGVPLFTDDFVADVFKSDPQMAGYMDQLNKEEQHKTLLLLIYDRQVSQLTDFNTKMYAKKALDDLLKRGY